MSINCSDPVGIYLKSLGGDGLLTGPEEKELARRIEEGSQDAREELVEKNLRLVIDIAKRYRGQGLPFSDLIQEGNIGLIKAVDRFDWRKGYKFSTYATHWIKQSILNAVYRQSDTIRIPAYIYLLLRRIRKEERKFRRKKGRTPTAAQLAENLGESEGRIRRAKRVSTYTKSLDRPLGEKGGGKLSQLLGQEGADPYNQAGLMVCKSELHELMKEKLSDRERRILKLRFGLERREEKTLKELAEIFSLSRERIRQLQNRALKKLNDPKLKIKLGKFSEP